MLMQLIQVEESGYNGKPGTVGHPFYDGGTLPVYTSPDSLLKGMKAYARLLEESDKIGFCIIDPFELADMAEDYQAYGLRHLVFDPPPAPEGEIWIVGDRIPVRAYCKAIEAIRPEFEKLSADAVDRFFQESHLNEEPYVRWPNASADDIAADLLARIEEWTECDQ